jgi:hypothetical protein
MLQTFIRCGRGSYLARELFMTFVHSVCPFRPIRKKNEEMESGSLNLNNSPVPFRNYVFHSK